jgi:hypothetical protein
MEQSLNADTPSDILHTTESVPVVEPGANSREGTPPQVTLMHIIERAAQAPEFDLDRLEKLLSLRERWERNAAREAFVEAMVAFKANPPKISKNKHVEFTTSRGVTKYDHATHAEVVGKIGEGLFNCGLSHAWTIQQDGNLISVTCTLTHLKGHSESATMKGLADESGGKNSIQAIASAITYLQRYTLLSVTGMTSEDLPDHDGRAPVATPGVDESVWESLRVGASMNSEALRCAWRALTDDVRKTISLHYLEQWTALKALAASKS